MAERVVYVEWLDPCCDSGVWLSNEQLIAEKSVAAIVYLADEDAEVRGDDWNDAPMCANAGPPYRNYRTVSVRYGEPWPSVDTMSEEQS